MIRKYPILFMIILLALVALACGGSSGDDAATATPETRTGDSNTNQDTNDTNTSTDTSGDTRNGQPLHSEKRAWTFLVYVDADNNLEEPGLLDVNEMEAAGKSDQVYVAIQIDRVSGETSADGNWTNTRRYEISGDNNTNKIGSKLVSELGELNMGDAKTLTDFLTWGVTNYPAEHYAVVLWDHGAGWYGVAFDDTGDGDGLTLPELDTAFSTALKQTGLSKFDIIGFDACLMGQLDVYQKVAPYANYAVGSEELVPGLGWDYEAILKNLYDDPSMSAEEWAQLMVSDFIHFYTKIEPDDYVTMSAIDLGKLPTLTNAINKMSTAIQADPSFTVSSVGDARGGAEGYALIYPEDAAYYASIDLWHFASILSQRSPDDTLTAAAKDVMNAVKEVVVSADHGSGFSQANGISVYFPSTLDYFNDRYKQESGLAPWYNLLASYHGLGLSDIPLPEFKIVNVLSDNAGSQNPGYMDVEITGRDIENVVLFNGRYEGGKQHLLQFDYLLPEPTHLEDGSLLYEWKDGVHKDFFVWNTEGIYLSDSTGKGDYVVMWPTEYNSPQYTVRGQFIRAGSSTPFDANLVFDSNQQKLTGVWTFQAEARSAPNEIFPEAGDQFRIYNSFIDDSGNLTSEPGVTITFDDNKLVYYDWRPLPSGNYFLGFRATNISGQTASDSHDFKVTNDNLDPGYKGYLDPYKGFQFLYPDSWYTPSYQDTLLYTYDIATSSTLMRITLYPEVGEATADDLKAQTLEQFGNPTIVQEVDVSIGGVDGKGTVYSYQADTGDDHTGAFLAFVNDGTGYVVDIDGLSDNSEANINALNKIIDTWVFQPVGFGLQPGNWASVEASNFTVQLPSNFSYEELDSGWQLFSSDDGYSFVALRTDPASGDELKEVVQGWVDVAGDGVDSFAAGDAYRYSLGENAWARVDFTYTADDGTDLQGFIMATIVDDQEVVGWAEAPVDAFAGLENSVFLVSIADLSLNDSATPTPEPVETPTSADAYLETFDSEGDWAVGSNDDVDASVTGGVFDFLVLADNALYWSDSGQNFSDGVYEVEATQVDGPENNGYGMVFRLNEDTNDFYLFEVSGDGYVWIGLCQDGCSSATTLVEDGWFASDAVNQGNATNVLRVIANGPSMTFYVNDQEVGTAVDGTLTSGDLGPLVETLGEGKVNVTFDNFSFTPNVGKGK